jgi:hypothetical protein
MLAQKTKETEKTQAEARAEQLRTLEDTVARARADEQRIRGTWLRVKTQYRQAFQSEVGTVDDVGEQMATLRYQDEKVFPERLWVAQRRVLVAEIALVRAELPTAEREHFLAGEAYHDSAPV